MVEEKELKQEKILYYENKVEGDNKARKISWIVAVIIIILSMFIAIVCTAIYTMQPSVPLEYDYVIENWKRETIRKLYPSNVGCLKYLTFYEYPGTIDGCDCKNSPSAEYNKKVYDESCTSDQESNSCKNINNTPIQEFREWRLFTQTLQICIERETGFNFMSSDCTIEGYKRCGVGKSEQSNPNMFCVPSNMQCPINSIVYGPTFPDNTYTQVIEVNGLKILTSSESLTNKPIAYSRISRGKGECKDFNNYHFVDTGVEEYKLVRGKDSTCKADETDNRFKILLQLGEKEYMDVNKQTDKLNALPDYPYNLQYYLLTREYIPWIQDGDCRKKHMSTFIDLKSKSDNVNNLWVGCIIVNWFVAIFYGILSNTLRLKLQWKIKNWYIIPTALLLLIQVVLTIVTFAFAADANTTIKNMSDSKCSDDQTNSFITKYSDDFSSTILTFQIVLLVFVIVLVIFTIFFMRTIFMILKLSQKNGDTILPSINMKKVNNTGNNSGKSNNAELLEERGVPVNGFYNTDVPGQQDATIYSPAELASNEATNKNINNIKNNQHDTVDSPIVIKVNDEEQAKKGVLKRVQINSQNQTPQNLNGSSNQTTKQTKFQEDQLNKSTDKTKDPEMTQTTNITKTNNLANLSIVTTNSSGAFMVNSKNNNNKNDANNNTSAFNNASNKNSPTKLNKGRTVEFIDLEDTNEKANINTVKETNKSRNDLQLNVVQNNNSKSASNLTSALPTPVKQMNQSQQSLSHLDNTTGNKRDLLNFESTYVPQQFEPGKAREKYLPHKFQKSQTRRLQSQHSLEGDSELYSPVKSKVFEKKLTNNLFPEKSNNNIQSMNHLIDQFANTENNEDNKFK